MNRALCIKFLQADSEYVFCPDIYHDYISKEHYFQYDETTTYRDLCNWVGCESKFEGNSFSCTFINGEEDCEYFIDEGCEIADELHIFYDEKIFEVTDKDVKLSKIIEVFGDVTELTLIWKLQWCGGKGVGENEGVKYIIKPNESTHMYTPHVHAEYSGKEISIKIKPVKLLSKPFRSPKKTKVAINYVNKHQDRLLKEWDITANLGLCKVDV